MQSRSEVDRITEVYRQYGERGWGKTKWAITNRGNQQIRQERERKLKGLLERADFLPLGNRRILDVGCGTGETVAAFEDLGAARKNLFGVDLLAERVRGAQANFPDLAFQEANAEALPFASGSFDLILLFTVLSSILDKRMARNVSRETIRVLRSGGAVVWYDFRMNNPLNPHVRGISRRRILEFFPGFDARLVTITLLPPLARRLGWLTHVLYSPLVSLPILRSHFLGLLIKP